MMWEERRSQLFYTAELILDCLRASIAAQRCRVKPQGAKLDTPFAVGASHIEKKFVYHSISIRDIHLSSMLFVIYAVSSNCSYKENFCWPLMRTMFKYP